MTLAPSPPAPTVPDIDPQDRHFRTDHLMADLKGRSVRGGAVTLGAQGVKFVLQLGSTMVLARLLTPADFGLVAMVTAVTGFVAMFKDLGLSQATVQRAEITHAQVSTLFWINVALSAALMFLLAALAPAIAWFYGEPRLTWITLALAGTFLFGGLTVQHQALLTRQMRFGWLAAIDILSIAAGVAAAVAMGWQGLGYWALVGMPAGTAIANALLVWSISTWRPGLPVRGSGVREMLKFGGNLAGFSVVNYFSRNADQVLIGWHWGAASLGIYSRAYQLLMMPLSQINMPLVKVVVPGLSRLQDQPQAFRAHYLKSITVILWLTVPLVAFLAGSARNVVLLVLGEQWIDAADVFRLLALTAAFQPIYNTIGWVFIGVGRTDRFLRWSLVAAPLFVLSFAIGLPWGAEGVALAYALTFCAMLPWTLRYTFRGTAITLGDIARIARLPLAVGAVCCVVSVGFESSGLPPAASLACSAGCGIAVVAGFLLLTTATRQALASILMPRFFASN